MCENVCLGRYAGEEVYYYYYYYYCYYYYIFIVPVWRYAGEEGWHKFSKVSALISSLYKVTIQRTLKTVFSKKK
jgi:hypothetical protein